MSPGHTHGKLPVAHTHVGWNLRLPIPPHPPLTVSILCTHPQSSFAHPHTYTSRDINPPTLSIKTGLNRAMRTHAIWNSPAEERGILPPPGAQASYPPTEEFKFSAHQAQAHAKTRICGRARQGLHAGAAAGARAKLQDRTHTQAGATKNCGRAGAFNRGEVGRPSGRKTSFLRAEKFAEANGQNASHG